MNAESRLTSRRLAAPGGAPLGDVGPLLAWLERLGLPAPVAVRALGTTGDAHDTLLLFPPGSRLTRAILREEVRSPGWDGLRAERTAIGLCSAIEGVPVPGEAHLVGSAALLLAAPDGVPGEVVLRRGPGPAAAVLRGLGAVMARLHAVSWPKHGTRPVDGLGFVPRRATWSEELGWRLGAWLERAERGGVGLGPPGAAAVAGLRARLPGLHPDRWTLVHLDLIPANLWVRPEDAAPTGLVGWSGACVGDPLLDWVQPLQLRPHALREVVVGYGVERAEAALSGRDVRERLGVYLGLRAIARLGRAADLPPTEDRRRARGQELARAALEVGPDRWLRDRLDALFVPDRPPAAAPRSVTDADLVRRRAVERLGHAPEPGPAEAAVLVAVLSAVELGAVAVADRLLRAIQPPRGLAHGEPVGAHDAFWVEQQKLAAQGSPLAQALVRAARRAVTALGEAASDRALRGLHTQVMGLSGHAGDRSARGRVIALLLAEPLDRDALAEAWDAFCPFPPLPRPDAPWPPDDWAPANESDALLAAARVALDRAPDDALPAPRAALWSALT